MKKQPIELRKEKLLIGRRSCCSEGDKAVGKPELVSRKAETSWGDVHASRYDGNGKEHFGLLCMHGFSAHRLLSKCTTTKKEQKSFRIFVALFLMKSFITT